MASLLHAAMNAHDLLINVCEYLGNGTPVCNGSDLHADAAAYRDQLSKAIDSAEKGGRKPSEIGGKPTPGPWHVGGNLKGDENRCPTPTIESDFGQVATVMGENCDLDEQVVADAYLIAAAPDLIDVCHKISLVHKIQDAIGPRNWLALSAAIAKSKGGAA